MAVSAHFQNEIDLVDNTKTLVFTTNTTTYAANEWSYNGLEITGYDDYALEHGASALLYAMGFRHYGPREEFIKRPGSIPTNLTAAKQKHWMPFKSCFLAYGFDSRYTDVRTTLTNNFNRWRTLNNMYDDRLPAGHRWKNIISNSTTYFNANPDMLIDGPATASAPKFNLSIAEPDYSEMVEYCAAFLLDAGLNSSNRTNFDPTDGDSQSSNLVWPFAKAVVDKMRAGTAAIGSFGAQAGVPDAQLGLYVYGGHRLPPDATDLSGLYAQVALAFNQTQYTYLELCQLFGQKVDFVALREYFDTMVWSLGVPQQNYRSLRRYYTVYQQYKDAGVEGVNGEFQANWLMNMVGINTGIRVMKTGASATSTYDAMVTSIVDDIFDGDPAVHALLTKWGKSYVQLNRFSLKSWGDDISDMVDGWYKTMFKQYFVILYEYLYLPAKTDSGFATAFASLMSKVHAVTSEDFFHSYAFERRLANGNVSSSHPTLWMYADPLPDWITNATAPTSGEFDTHYAALTADAYRQEELNSDDLVLVKVTPPTTGLSNPDGKIRVGATSTFCFVGPGTAVFTDENGVVENEVNFGPGKHLISQTFNGAGFARATNGGRIFLYVFPQKNFPYVTVTSGQRHDLWMYVPNDTQGLVELWAEAKIRMEWTGGSAVVSGSITEAQQAAIPAGQVAIKHETTNTYALIEFGNVNPWLSPYSNYALMSRELAELDFPSRVSIGVPAFSGSDDSIDPAQDETTEEIDG